MITVIGEALLDVVTDPGGERRSHPGGSPANVAVTLARLGTPVALLTRLGRDEAGDQVERHLRDNDVALPGALSSAAPTSVAEATLDAAGGASYEFRLGWDLEEDDAPAPGSTCLHIGSLGAVLEPGATAVRRIVAASQVAATISYDPNCRPVVTPDVAAVRADVERWVGLSDIVKVSSEDLEWLYGGDAAADVAQRWLGLGPALVVVTRGGDGVHAACAAGTVDRPPLRVDVVDTVGAGDSFTGGLLDGLSRAGLLGAHRRTALHAVPLDVLAGLLDDAALVAGLTCARPGADPPTRDEVAEARTGQDHRP